jgi:hypothetical protein
VPSQINRFDGLAILNSEPQNIEYRTAEYRRMVSLCSVLLLKQTQYLTSISDIQYAIFVFLAIYKEQVKEMWERFSTAKSNVAAGSRFH